MVVLITGHIVGPESLARHIVVNTRKASTLVCSKPEERHGLIQQYLDVENSPRYKPTEASTYCNVYACDYAGCWGAYIPRVWGNLKPGQLAVYGKNVYELNANELYAWFASKGSAFGWKEATNEEAALSAANDGKLCILVAKNNAKKMLNGRQVARSGHITIVLPDTLTEKTAEGYLLQSQAGKSCHKSALLAWHRKPNFGYKFYYC